jgi:hypothetical protein
MTVIISPLFEALNSASGLRLRLADGVQAHISASRNYRGDLNLVLLGSSEKKVTDALEEVLSTRKSRHPFMPPVRLTPGVWCSMGRI